jgi:hypothetical protein
MQFDILHFEVIQWCRELYISKFPERPNALTQRHHKVPFSKRFFYGYDKEIQNVDIDVSELQLRKPLTTDTSRLQLYRIGREDTNLQWIS